MASIALSRRLCLVSRLPRQPRRLYIDDSPLLRHTSASARESTVSSTGLRQVRLASDVVPAKEEVSREVWLTVRGSESEQMKAEGGKTAASLKSEAKHVKMLEPEDLQSKLEHAFAEEVVDLAVQVCRNASDADFGLLWPVVLERLKAVEFVATDAIRILHCMVLRRVIDKDLLSKVVDVMERAYFSMQPGFDAPPDELLKELGCGAAYPRTFKALVDILPVGHKVKLILLDDFSRPTGDVPPTAPIKEVDGKKQWRAVDPVEMELQEREQYFKGRIKIKRIRYVEAKVTKMRPGKKLRSTLAVNLMQLVPQSSPALLAEIAQVCAFRKLRLLRGDLQLDFEEGISSRLIAEDPPDPLRPFLLAYTSALNRSSGRRAYAAWRRVLLPLTKGTIHQDATLSRQCCFHDQLACVSEALPRSENPQVESLRATAERAARLLISVTTARFVCTDMDMLDTLIAPLHSAIEKWLAHVRCQPDDTHRELLLPIETIADVLDACVASRAESPKFTAMLGELFLEQCSADESLLARSDIAEISVIAHGLSMHSLTQSQEITEVLWQGTRDRLRTTQPHRVLMLLNAFVRQGSPAFVESKEFLEAVDEHLTKRLDFDPRVLGHLGT